MSSKQHRCDERCVCPVHDTPLFYSPSNDDHACTDVDCVHGHGGLTPGVDPAWYEAEDPEPWLPEMTDDEDERERLRAGAAERRRRP